MSAPLAYKVLGHDLRSFHGGSGAWTLGKSRSVTAPLAPCRRGIHYCQRGQLVQWLGPRIFLFEDETPDETIDGGDKMVTRRGRIVQEVAAWNERTARLFAADCAEAVLDAIPETHREPFAAAISVTRRFADGTATDAERSAAESAARSAAESAAGSAQTEMLFAYLEAPVTA